MVSIFTKPVNHGNDNQRNSFYNSTRVSTSNDNTTNSYEENTSTESNNNTSVNYSKNVAENPPAETETLLTDFTTKIYTKDPERQNNINITCSTLNGTLVNNGETFSFCNTVGKATSNRGYKKADVYQDGEKIQALGGGNCQVSSTLYNAVLKIPELQVTERHEHSNSVPYVSKGKDAAVAYGSYDFQFINNTGNQIKILSSSDSSYVYIQIFKIA